MLVGLASVRWSWGAPHGYLPYGVAAGVLGTAGLVAFYWALAAGPMGLVAAIASTAVLLPVLVGVGHGERPGTLRFVAIALTILGIVLASGAQLRGGQRAAWSTILLSLVAAVGFGGYYTAMAGGAQHDLTMVLVTQRISGLLIVGPLLLRSRISVGFSGKDLALAAAIGLGDVAANAAYGLATRNGLLSVVAVLASLYPLVTALLARSLLRERLRPAQRVGAFTAVTGVLLLAATG
ncbi:MAG: DMT family transporter [Actinobacteria bacterium]|nr:DMT family transporter [Actinomycetota bacterium]MBI3686257.1 DMT family transporter [Actinomycetota bacterium]